MKKTPHQVFVEELQKQIASDVVHQTGRPKNKNCGCDEGARKDDIMKELERKFDELFGTLDDDD